MSETAEQQQADIFLRKFTRELPVTLNDHENQVYGKMLAEKVNELKLAEDKKKQVVADHNNRIKVIENEITRIAVARAKGEELRPVTCGERLHGNVIEIVRIDRGEVVDTRPADLKDLQTDLPGMGMPQIPEGFDEGPRGSGLGSLADEPVNDEAPAEMVESSAGDQVYVTDATEGDGEEHEPTEDGGTMHGATPEEYDGDVPDGETPDNVVRPDFGGARPLEGESEEDALDRYLAERETEMADVSKSKPESSPMSQRDRDVAQREKEIAEAKNKKPARSRSAKANNAKKPGKKK